MNRLFPFRPVMLLSVMLLISIATGHADDGYRLWLRYDPLPAAMREFYDGHVTSIIAPGESATMQAVRDELARACGGLLAREIASAEPSADGAIIAGTTTTCELIAGLEWDTQLAALGDEGYRIASVTIAGNRATVIAARTETGVLYGAFHFIRMMQTGVRLEHVNITENPRLKLRVLNHWDNLNGSIERGYAGRSLWHWADLPATVDDRLTDYARACASVGINGSVLNNVNANATILTPGYLNKVSAIAGVFRPYGIRVYLSARFSAPIEIGGLKTADPLEPAVQDWWRAKADEIYALIPDFGGFLVKANSEGQPGPQTYSRTHAQGANMLAEALAPHGGVVMWRAFVYDMKPGYDRAGAAVDSLQPLDGQFAPNVLLQVKNGPIDFQPREPFHPLFGSMPNTQLMAEVQITQEYLGQSNSLVYHGPMWREFLDADTFARGPGSTVAGIIDGTVYNQQLTGIAGVANTGSDRDWCGHIFSQANWYAFGRLAWNPRMDSRAIAREWTAMTLTHDHAAAETIVRIMQESHEAAVDAMMPLGLHHLFAANHHYGPGPWESNLPRDDWNPTYYHRADARGIGFDRTAAGSGTLSQYAAPVQALFGDPATCPPEFLLWFHHVDWDWTIPATGRTVWDELALRYQHGVDWARATQADWHRMAGAIDPELHAAVTAKLETQLRDDSLWKNACLAYFHTLANHPYPGGVEPPSRTLDEYKSLRLSH